MIKVFIFLCFVTIVYTEDFDKENEVYILNTDNFDDIISVNKPMLINFYAPWCQFSQKLKPHFDRVAEDFAKQKIKAKLGKVDVVLETELAKRFNIKRYPTLIFFKEDRQIYYNKTNNHVTISNWLISKTDNLILNINTEEEYKGIKKYDIVLTIDESKYLASLNIVAENIDDIQFVVLNSQLFSSLFSNYRGASMILWRKVDDATIPFQGSVVDGSIRRFALINDLPPVVTYGPENGAKIFSNLYKEQHFLVFVSSNTGTFKQELENAAVKHEEIRFAIIDVTNNLTDNLVAYFKVDKSSVPYMILSDVNSKRSYRPNFSEINGDQIDRFITDVKSGKVEEFLKSQPIPEDWNSAALKVLVGKNFEQVAYDRTKHVFVEFYAPWCAHCKQLAPIWEKLAQSLADLPDLIIAKMDKTENDVKNIEISAFPTLKLFLKDTNEVINYSGLRSKEAFIEFLSKYTDMKTEQRKHEL